MSGYCYHVTLSGHKQVMHSNWLCSIISNAFQVVVVGAEVDLLQGVGVVVSEEVVGGVSVEAEEEDSEEEADINLPLHVLSVNTKSLCTCAVHACCTCAACMHRHVTVCVYFVVA